MKMMMSINPLMMAISIMFLSTAVALIIFKTTLSSWLTFVLILTFSSGMMTLFIYASSLAPNEKTKTKKNMKLMILMAVILITPSLDPKNMKESMKTFSSQVAMMIMMMILMTTMMTIAMHGYTPNQPVS